MSALVNIKRRLLVALKRRKIASVVIHYDGEGDSGQVQSVSALDHRDHRVFLQAPIRLALHDPKNPTSYTTLQEALDDFAWTILAEFHAGFENNDGGFGTIRIDVDKRVITIEHNDRVFDVLLTTTEV